MSGEIERLTLPPGRRILVISDIHGNLPYLKGVLDKAGFCDSDVLIIDGDFLEKGKYSLDTLRYIMELCRRGSTHVVRGNCDGWHMILHWDEEMAGRTLHYMDLRQNCLLRQMCRAVGVETDEWSDVEQVRHILREHYADEMAFLEKLPIIIDTEHYTFVHGGISAPSAAEAEPQKCMKNDNFLGQGLSFRKWQIVGHWPVVLYREDKTDANPIILRDRKIVSIDGGCVLKDDGQLNCLIIPEPGSEDFAWVYYDPFPTAEALDSQAESVSSYYIRWGDNLVEVLAEGEEFSRCRHIRTGYEMDILTDFLKRTPNGITTNDCTDYRLGVEAGERLSIVRRTSRGYLCKKNGVSGWYTGRLAE
ncbi:MAG: metallophosphoesterase [Candidatus Heteroscillospira sp.]